MNGLISRISARQVCGLFGSKTTKREAGGWRVEIHAIDRKPVVEFLVLLDTREDAASRAVAPVIDARTACVIVDGATIGFVRAASPGARFHVSR